MRLDITEKMSKHLFISNLRSGNENDNSLYIKLNFIRNKQEIEKLKR
jgi:hypothetical protein